MAKTNVRGGQIADGANGVDLTVDVTGLLPIANGGTNAASASAARTNLGLAIGTDVQAYDADLAAIALLTATTGNIIQSVAGAWSSRTPAQALTALGIPCDFVWISQTGTRAVGIGDLAAAHRVGRAMTLTAVIYQFDTADASGSTAVESRLNGSQITSSNLTVTAANQVDGTGTDAARTATINQSCAVGDRLTPWITSLGTTPGRGFRAYYLGTWN